MDDGENEEYEVLDLTALRKEHSWLQNVLGDISKQSAAKQVAIGGASGWCAGYLFVKVGKVAAATLGMTVLLVQIAQYRGYIQINWKKVRSEMHQATRQIRREVHKNYPEVTQTIAQHQGYLKINWSRVEKEVDQARRQIRRDIKHNQSKVIGNLQMFFRQNMFLAGGFAGGFLIGLAF